MARGLFVGLTTIDIFNIVPHHPRPNQKIKAQRQSVCAGGPAANAAVAFAAFGNDAHLCSGLGKHPTATLATVDLQEHGVMFHDYADKPDQLPVLSSILIDSSTGERCVIYTDPYNRELSLDCRYDQLVTDHSVILFDGFYLEQAMAMARAAKAAQAKDIVTVLDGGSWKNGLEKLLPFIDYAICSDDFVPPGCSTLNEKLSYFTDLGVTGCAVSRGSEPIIINTAGQVSEQPVSRVVAAVDTLGAGDILHGAFCHFILSHPFPQSLKFSKSNSFSFVPLLWYTGMD